MEGDAVVKTVMPTVTACMVLVLFLAIQARAVGSVSINSYSQEVTRETSYAGGSISDSQSSEGSRGSNVSYGSGLTTPEGGSAARESSSTPAGASPAAGGITPCVAAQEQTGVCIGVVPNPAAAPQAQAPPGKAPAVNPAVLAATVAARLPLTAGRLQASPSAQMHGLTGVASWFWLSPAPGPESLSVALGGERLTVTASASSVTWTFGDGTVRSGGPGVPYRDGPVPAGALRHVYQTRCLPGDAGRDPNVLPSCSAEGYTVTATVNWTIAYTAAGHVSSGGSLPERATSTSTAYPVSEARSFLTSGGSA
jgi:hypothetical protein